MKDVKYWVRSGMAVALTVVAIFSFSGKVYSQSVFAADIESTVRNYVRMVTSPSTEYIIEFKDLRSKYDIGFSNPSLSVSVANSLIMKGLVTFMVKVKPRSGASINYLVIPVTAKIRTFEKVLVATQMIQPHTIIDSGLVSIIRSETTEIPNPVTSIDQLIGKWTNRWIQTGRILTSDMFDVVPLVKRGDDVTVIFRTKNVIVKDRGTALQDGKLNEIIKVTNEYKETLMGKVIGKGEVLLLN